VTDVIGLVLLGAGLGLQKMRPPAVIPARAVAPS
jgi:hypothetical protein